MATPPSPTPVAADQNFTSLEDGSYPDPGNREFALAMWKTAQKIRYSAPHGWANDTPSNKATCARFLLLAARLGHIESMAAVGDAYFRGDAGLPKDEQEARNWMKKAADAGHWNAMVTLESWRSAYELGKQVNNPAPLGASIGPPVDDTSLFRYTSIFLLYDFGSTWLSADRFAKFYETGSGTIQDDAEAYRWLLVAKANWLPTSTSDTALENGLDTYLRDNLDARLEHARSRISSSQAEVARLKAKSFKPISKPSGMIVDPTRSVLTHNDGSAQSVAAGTGFVISRRGHILTAAHVVGDATSIEVHFGTDTYRARSIAVDRVNDVAVLKIDATPPALILRQSGGVTPGDRVSTIGFPNPDIQGQSPKYTDGTISSTSGAGDDPRAYQVSAPVQPGNSGGPLLDADAKVIGLITSRLDDAAVTAISGAVPQNVNYAIKSAYIVPVLQGVPELVDNMAKDSFSLFGRRKPSSEDLSKSVCIIIAKR